MQGLLCKKCENYIFDKKCEAFPKGIPQEVFNGTHDHKKPFKGDNGIRYKEIKIKDEGKK